jgi:hypothetical protein
MSEFYKVVAPLVLVKDEDGRVNYAYQDAVVRLSDEQAAHFVEEGLVEESDGGAYADDGSDDVPDESWKRDEIDAWAAENFDPPLDTTGAGNKADALALISEALAAADESGG